MILKKSGKSILVKSLGDSIKDTMIKNCMLEGCSYNENKRCHAVAITIGDGDHPRCDTFITSKTKGGFAQTMGKVGACKVEKCYYNASLECTSENIKVGFHDQHPDCLTFNSG